MTAPPIPLIRRTRQAETKVVHERSTYQRIRIIGGENAIDLNSHSPKNPPKLTIRSLAVLTVPLSKHVPLDSLSSPTTSPSSSPFNFRILLDSPFLSLPSRSTQNFPLSPPSSPTFFTLRDAPNTRPPSAYALECDSNNKL